MKTLTWSEGGDPTHLCEELAAVIESGGLVCLPCAGSYRIVADLTNADAVMALMQSKSRVHEAPVLVFVSNDAKVQNAGHADPQALHLAKQLWPEPLTIRVKPHPDLPGKVLKQLGGKKSKFGVRVPADGLMRALVDKVGNPLLVSSANRERKSGESSPAQIRKNFAARIDVFVDQGDLKPQAPSTVIDIKDGKVVVERQGAISAEMLDKLVQAAV